MASRDFVGFDQGCENPAVEHARSHRGRAQVECREQRRFGIETLRAGQLEVFARRWIEDEKLLTPIELRFAETAFAVGDSGSLDERAERVDCSMNRQRLLHRKAVEVRSIARFDQSQRGCSQTRAGRLDGNRDGRAHLGRNVGNDLRRRYARQLREQLVVRVIAGDRGGGAVTRRDVGVGDCESFAGRRHRGQIVVLFAVE